MAQCLLYSHSANWRRIIKLAGLNGCEFCYLVIHFAPISKQNTLRKMSSAGELSFLKKSGHWMLQMVRRKLPGQAARLLAMLHIAVQRSWLNTSLAVYFKIFHNAADEILMAFMYFCFFVLLIKSAVGHLPLLKLPSGIQAIFIHICKLCYLLFSLKVLHIKILGRKVWCWLHFLCMHLYYLN